MLTVDEVLPFLGCPLDQRRVESLFGTSGHRSADELDPSHPQDQRHYYSFPEFGIQFILGENDVIQTIFFHIEGDPDVAPYPWSFENGINPSSTRNDVLASFGRPERSGKPNADGTIAAEGWDRFKSYANFIHLQYATGGAGIAMITAMVAAASPPMPIPLDYKVARPSAPSSLAPPRPDLSSLHHPAHPAVTSHTDVQQAAVRRQTPTGRDTCRRLRDSDRPDPRISFLPNQFYRSKSWTHHPNHPVLPRNRRRTHLCLNVRINRPPSHLGTLPLPLVSSPP